MKEKKAPFDPFGENAVRDPIQLNEPMKAERQLQRNLNNKWIPASYTWSYYGLYELFKFALVTPNVVKMASVKTNPRIGASLKT